MIDPSEIPEFTGDLATLATDIKGLNGNAGKIRDTGQKVHTDFQGLSAYYQAPEAEQLFATTKPVQDRADQFAGKLEKVTAALDAYSTEVRPIIAKLKQLRIDAAAFVKECGHGDHWKYDGGKVKRNNTLIQDVAAATAAFWDAERRAANAITALVGGTQWTTDDGSHKPGMYGYKADDLEHAKSTPWGSQDSQKHHLYDVGHWVKAFVWDGLIVDGAWSTLKGLGTLAGFGGWDAFKQSWTGLGHLAVGLGVSSLVMGPLGPVVLAVTPDKDLPGFLKDGKHAVVNAGKSMAAWDEWGKNPARAAGAVTFNVLTAVVTDGAGDAAKAGSVAKAISIAGKGGRLIDPMTYVMKGAGLGLTKLKVGDMLGNLKNLHAGTTIDLPDGTVKLPDGTLPHPVGTVHVPDGAPVHTVPGEPVHVPDGAPAHPAGSVRMPDGDVLHPDGTLVKPDGTIDHTVPSEMSAADRQALTDAQHDLHQPEPTLVHTGGAPEHEAAHVGDPAGAHDPGGVRASNDPPAHGGAGGGPHDPPTHNPSVHTGPIHDPAPTHTGGSGHSGGGHSAGGGEHPGGGGSHPGGTDHPGGEHPPPRSPIGPEDWTRPVEDSGPMERGGALEREVHEQVRHIVTNETDRNTLFENLGTKKNGDEVAHIIASGRYNHSEGYDTILKNMTGKTKPGTVQLGATQYDGSVEALRIAERFHDSGIPANDIAFEQGHGFEVKEGVFAGPNTDLDVFARGHDGTTFGYQLKDIGNPDKIVNKYGKSRKQLFLSNVDVRTFVVDTRGTLADLDASDVPSQLMGKYGADHIQFIIRTEDGVLEIPPDGKFMPGGAG